MRTPKVVTHPGVLIQAWMAAQTLYGAFVAVTDPETVTRLVVVAAGYKSWVLLGVMSACALWLLLDWLLCIEAGCRGWLCALCKWRIAAAMSLAVGLVMQAYVAHHVLHVPGFVGRYLLDAVLICGAVWIDAQRRRHKDAARRLA